MNGIIQDVELAVLEMNPVAAKISIVAKTSATRKRAGCFEVGVDGGKPDSPLAVAEENLTLRIGTPFLWSQDSQPGYAVIVSVEQGGKFEQGEIQFGFDATGKIVVTQPLKQIFPTLPKVDPTFPSLFVVGDSTAFSNGKNQRGWGDELAGFFTAEKINVLNRARPGRSTRSFRNEGLWSRVLAEIKAGDVVLIQFGHNDVDKIAEGRCRGVLPGVGEETQTVTMPDGGTEAVHTYGSYLRRFVDETKRKGATPVLLSVTAKNLWQGERFVRQQGAFVNWAKMIADERGVSFLNLTAMAADRYQMLGRIKVQPLFCSPTDNVHTSSAGAKLNAALVAEALKGPVVKPNK